MAQKNAPEDRRPQERADAQDVPAMNPTTIRLSPTARVVAKMYLDSRRHADAVAATDSVTRATFEGRRTAWAIQLAEELAPLIDGLEGPSVALTIEAADPRELEARLAATAFEHRQGGVGTVQPETMPAPADDDEPSAGDHPLFVGGAP